MIETLVGLHVVDAEVYAEYRRRMTPLLQSVGGGFRYDFEISQTLKAETPETINRLFIITFPNPKAREEFFKDSTYLEIKQALFERGVAATTIIAEYSRGSENQSEEEANSTRS
ncbi:DUF1330 domain-containing protein [Roseibacillus persicicus]|uniref:DUF1330 domain-containing protein n=1 Tax=Roseibacillus persicicus TaxID=454148 RepID=A0A918TD74_9BACT|nr:DUF1330 domain-containing protein [Roseibacillus persicicus]GHC40076.1 hypothetical protein GCM10007100_00480 [Roseibacillus persicicus]